MEPKTSIIGIDNLMYIRVFTVILLNHGCLMFDGIYVMKRQYFVEVEKGTWGGLLHISLGGYVIYI